MTAPGLDGADVRPAAERLARGQGRFTADVTAGDLAHLAFVRSTVAHARVASLDLSAAREVPGVVAILTAADLQERGIGPLDGSSGQGRPVLAGDIVRFQGQEVAAVVAETPYAAADAAELVDVDYEPLEVVTGGARSGDPGEGAGADSAGAPAFSAQAGQAAEVEEALAGADLVVRFDGTYPRSHPVPLETSACVVVPDARTGTLGIALTSETPEEHRALLAGASGVGSERLQVLATDLGGGFGAKDRLYPGHVATIVAAEETGRAVSWSELRSESHVATTAVGDCGCSGALGVRADGTLVATDVRLRADAGAYLTGDWQPLAAAALEHAGSAYRLGSARLSVEAVLTNKSPVAAHPAGLPRAFEVTFVVERLLDGAATALGIDPLELRLANLAETADGPSPADALRGAAEAAGYDAVRSEQRVARERAGAVLPGLGVALCGDGDGGCAAFAAVVGVDTVTGEWTVQRLAVTHPWGDAAEVDVRGGVAHGFALAAMEAMEFDEEGNCIGANFMDYLLPTAWEAPRVAVHPLAGSAGRARSTARVPALAAAGSVPALAGAVVDALSHLGVRQVALPMTSGRVWDAVAAAGH